MLTCFYVVWVVLEDGRHVGAVRARGREGYALKGEGEGVRGCVRGGGGVGGLRRWQKVC